jgi:hypothetical protein
VTYLQKYDTDGRRELLITLQQPTQEIGGAELAAAFDHFLKNELIPALEFAAKGVPCGLLAALSATVPPVTSVILKTQKFELSNREPLEHTRYTIPSRVPLYSPRTRRGVH